MFSCLCSQATLSFSHSLTLSLSHSFTLSFTHSRHAEQLLFSSLCSKFAICWRKLQCFFLTSSSSPYPLTLEFTEQRAGSQLIIFRIIIRIIIIKAQLSSYISSVHRDQMAGFQNVLQLFVSNTAHLFLLEVCNRSTATCCCSSCSRREHSLGGRLSRAGLSFRPSSSRGPR